MIGHRFFSTIATGLLASAPGGSGSALTQLGTSCKPQQHFFLGLPTWYEYLPGQMSLPANTNATTATNSQLVCAVRIENISDIWLIVAAGIEILLRLAALAAVVFVIIGAVQFITSQGEPEAAASARKTIINALVGLLITVVAATVVTFIAGQFKAS